MYLYINTQIINRQISTLHLYLYMSGLKQSFLATETSYNFAMMHVVVQFLYIPYVINRCACKKKTKKNRGAYGWPIFLVSDLGHRYLLFYRVFSLMNENCYVMRILYFGNLYLTGTGIFITCDSKRLQKSLKMCVKPTFR